MKKILTLLLLMAMNLGHSRPVSYPGGWTIMQMNELDTKQLHVHYSPTAKYSVGFKAEEWQQENFKFYGFQYNRLLKRWNKSHEQANIYFKSGLGMVDPNDESGSSEAHFLGLAADWETRRWFTSYENRYYDLGKQGTYFNQKLRLGVAPYIGDYGDLHTWMMLQLDYHPKRTENYSVTPMLRFFKGPYMLEAGYSNRDEYLLNFIIRL